MNVKIPSGGVYIYIVDNSGECWYGIIIFPHTPDVQPHGLRHPPLSLFQGLAGRNATGKVRDMLQNTVERAGVHVIARVARNCYAPLLQRVCCLWLVLVRRSLRQPSSSIRLMISLTFIMLNRPRYELWALSGWHIKRAKVFMRTPDEHTENWFLYSACRVPVLPSFDHPVPTYPKD